MHFLSLLRSGSLRALFACTLTATLFAQHGSEGAHDEHEPHGSLRDFDLRLDGDQPAGFVLDVLRAEYGREERLAREERLEELRQRIPQLRYDESSMFGLPHFLRSTVAPLTEQPSGNWNAFGVVSEFLQENAAVFQLDELALEDSRVTRSYTSKRAGTLHWTLQQRHLGYDVFGAELRANFLRTGALLNIGSDYLPTPEEGFKTSAFRLDPRAALEAALASIGESLPKSAPELAEGTAWPRLVHWQHDDWERPLQLERILFPLTRTELRAAYHVHLGGLGGLNNYRVVLDAETGGTLWRLNEVYHYGGTEDATFRVYTTDSPNPLSPGLDTVGTFAPSEVSRQLLVVPAGAVTAQSPNGWINDGVNTTVGNNCIAQSDVFGTNNADPRPVGSPYRVFDQPIDLSLSPDTYTPASVINLFYWGNEYHDRLYIAGFDEASGNFQDQNFGNGGQGGDAMLLDAQDGGDTNNARYFHGPEGSPGRIEMYRWTTTPQTRDGTLDSDVVFHELAHGTSIRLAGSLNAHQSAGMGEGWSDFIGLSLNSEAGDDPDANYPAGPYAAFMLGGSQNSYYFGIRRFPYTTDLNKNPLTFNDIDPGQLDFPPTVPINPVIGSPVDSVHRLGEVWCSALWDARANLITTYGFGGNNLMLELVIEGLKLGPSTPNFLEARDGILQADLALHGGANLADLWSAFAKRGLGDSATSPSAFSVTGVSEAFDIPSNLFFSYPNGLPTQLLPNQVTPFDVLVNGTSQPLMGSGMLNYRVNGGSFSQIPMIENAIGDYTAELPALACFDTVEFYVSAADNVATHTDPATAPTELYSARVFEGVSPAFVDDFESNQGWTVSTSATDGGWERGVPVNNDRGDPAADFDGSGTCFLTDNDAGDSNSDVDNGDTTVTSPLMDLSQGAIVSYAYWFNDVPSGPVSGGDSFDVEVATDAGSTNWTLLRSYTTASSSWRTDQIQVGEEITATSTMRFRFTASDVGNQNVIEAGLDAFDASQLDCNGLGTEYCFGDGSGWFCPCGNESPLGSRTGCLNGSLLGAKIVASGEANMQNDTLHFDLIQAPPGSFSVLVSGDNQLNGGLGILAFNGLRCVGGNFQRHGGRAVGMDGQAMNGWGGTANPVIGLIAQGQFSVGQTRNFQVFFREEPQAICLEGQNSSTAFSLTIQP